MSNAGQPGKPPKSQASSFDDIPIAERETIEAPKQPRSFPWLWTIGGLVAIGLLAGGGWWAFQGRQAQNSAPKETVAATENNNAMPAPSPSATPSWDGRLLNHFAYTEAPKSELEPVSADGGIKLRAPAAKAFQEMVAAANADGVVLVPLSGFRSISEQQQVYFDVKAERAQSLQERALVSAPPGYSEHHTGYAIDVGDGNVPATNLSPDFEGTPAFKWLSANATRFNFEMSFPKNNKQGVTYEPWHWRFVGDKQSLETFYKAKQFKENN